MVGQVQNHFTFFEFGQRGVLQKSEMILVK